MPASVNSVALVLETSAPAPERKARRRERGNRVGGRGQGGERGGQGQGGKRGDKGEGKEGRGGRSDRINRYGS